MSDAKQGSELSELKAALLRQWREGRVAAPATPVIPVHGPGPAPLSYAQRRLWFLDQLTPGSSAFNLSHCVLLDGRLDPAVLALALEDLVARHDTLRTVIRVVDDEPLQLVNDTARPSLETVDLRDLPVGQAFEAALSKARAAVDAPMNLATGPLARLLLIRLPEQDMLVMVVHHIIGDGWALAVAVLELSSAYQARAAGSAPVHDPLPIRFADVAAHERHSGGSAGDLEYWRDRLAGISPLRLPGDEPRPPEFTTAGDWRELPFDDGDDAAIRAAAREAGATPYMVLLTALAVLLRQTTGARDIAIAGVVAGRDLPETRGLIGNLTNTVGMRVGVETRQSFHELLASVRRTCLEALEHQHVPFDLLVEELDLPRDASSSGPFGVTFVMQPPSPVSDFAGLRLEPVQLGWRTARADLEFFLWERPAVHGSLVFRTDLFGQDTAELLARRFVATVRTLLARPDEAIAELDLPSAQERRELARLAFGPERERPPMCVHELIARHCRERPEAVAVTGALTYGRLDRRANRLARRLVERGVGVESLVAVCLERSPDLVVAALGVLKAGAVHVPIDPAHGPRRRAEILADSGATVVIGTAEPDLVLDEGEEAEPPDVRVGAENLAYMIYTSGSTGTPKGVEISHRAAVNYVHSLSEVHGIGPDDVVGAVASPAFDASIAEIFGTLALGGRIHLVDQDDLGDGLENALVEGGVTVLSATPTLWRLLRPDNLLLTALVGGERVSERLATELAATQRAAWTQYGPTETTVWVTAAALTLDSPVPLGKPIANTRVHLLDEELRLVPIGAVGELCVSGAALARGYHGRAAATAERFVPDPFATVPGERLYRTGDYARYRPDGTLQFIGRNDDQVKVRGHRVEPGEIEAAIEANPRVRECAVAVQGDLLVAYLVSRNKALYEDTELIPAVRRQLRGQLPAYLVPDRIVLLDELPRTGTGKTDRARLPAPAQGERAAGTPYTEPCTELEIELAAHVAEYLEVDRIGLHDDFFDLGGNSIRAAQLVVHLQRRYDVELVLQKVFRTPTLENLARMIQEDLDRRRRLADEGERIRSLVEGVPADHLDALLEGLLAERGQS
ncbi:amino acid adenylation domain-containing protein [Nonomuraea sp. NPDC049152]|uniref:non-ribosomal peptide synthetase n=1 Tax=Nonomuraea sp. NPDC049152 TaxID=3154350 RepID=UPI0034031FBD